MVKIFGLKASEIALVRGAVQIMIFSMIVAVKAVSEDSTDAEQGNKKVKPVADRVTLIKRYLLVCVYGILVSTSSFSVTSALPLMPIGDLVVICFTSPIFSVFFDAVILKRKLTILSIVLCMFIGKFEIISRFQPLFWLQCLEIFLLFNLK